VLHRTNLSGTQNPPLLCHTNKCQENKPTNAVLHNLSGTQNPPLLCYTEPICQNTKPATAVLHRTNLSEHKTHQLCATQNQCQNTKTATAVITEPICQNTKPATAVLHRTNLPSICHGQPASRLLCFRFERRSLAVSLRLCVVMAGMQFPT